jgi:hypothetical protein
MKYQRSKEESAANVECSIGGVRHPVEWRSGLKGSDKVSEVALEHGPNELAKSPRKES